VKVQKVAAVSNPPPNLIQADVTMTGGTGLAMAPSGYSLVLAPTPTDYAATAMTNLWFGWAQYYLNNGFNNFTPIQNITGSVKGFQPANGNNPKIPGNVLTINPNQVSAGALMLGMQVTGPGIFPVDSTHPPTTIVGLLDSSGAPDYLNPTQVLLSQLVIGDASGTTYKFDKPPAFQGATDYLTQTNPVTGKPWVTPVNITFTGQTKQQQQETLFFAAAVYQSMYMESTIGAKDLFKSPTQPHAQALVGTVIGFDATHLPNSNPGQGDIGGNLRDIVKSILRGVYDFRKIPDESQWYPAPGSSALNSNNKGFNVFNLDPYVYFVHRVLGLSGYGFSIDDDAADVGSGGFPLPQTGSLPNNLSMTYTNLTGLPNQNEWFPSVPWGQITAQATIFQGIDPSTGKRASIIQFADTQAGQQAFSQVKADAPKEGFVGAYVSGPAGLPPLLRIAGPGPGGETARTFVLSAHVDPMSLTSFTFTGKPANNFVDPIVNGSFETPVTPPPSPPGQGGFIADPSGPGVGWTFGPGGQFPPEGIATNDSAFTAGNPPAPDGNQVAWIIATGKFSQTVTLTAGTYALSFFAAQIGRNYVSNQTLRILIDGQPWGNDIKPDLTTYQTFTTPSKALRAGPHTITFEGLSPFKQMNDDIALIDKAQLTKTLVALSLPNPDAEANVFRSGTWFLDEDQASYAQAATEQVQFGMAGDIPVEGDWLGAGITTIGVFRPSTGTWYLDTTNTDYDAANTIQLQFGMAGDIPVVGKWLGDGVTYVGVFRPSTGTWYLSTFLPDPGTPGAYSAATTIQVQFGAAGDIPEIGHWLGNGIDRIGVFRPSTGTWYLDDFGGAGTYRSGGTTAAYDPTVTAVVQFGALGDIPVVGDWLGTGTSQIGVYRPSTGQWFLDTAVRSAGTVTGFNSTAAIDIAFGTLGDIPVVGPWLNDGVDMVGVWRPSTGQWFLDTVFQSPGVPSGYDPLNTTVFQFGNNGDAISF
jgi:hypothetical protein